MKQFKLNQVVQFSQSHMIIKYQSDIRAYA